MAVKKKKVVKKKVKKSKTTPAKKKSSASKKRAPAKKAGKTSKKKPAVKKKSKAVAKKSIKKAKVLKKAKVQKKPKASPKKSPVKKPAAKVVAKKAIPKKVAKVVAKKAAPKKVVEPPEEIIKPVVFSPFKRNDPKILKIQDRLNQDRKRLMGMLRSSKEVERTINDITFSNEIDLASSLEGREMAFQLSSRERNELRMVEEALFKIKGNTYGVCDNCSKYITLKRLEILPLTALCIACQENLEVR